MMKLIRTLLLLTFSILNCHPSHAALNPLEKQELERIYLAHFLEPSDINEHLSQLKQLASECSSVVEIGTRSMVSTWGILQGLSDSQNTSCSYVGIDLHLPPWYSLQRARELAESQGISFQFWMGNDMTMDIHPVDMLFIDSLHTYCHLTYELEKFSPKVRKYIAMHDTSAPWGLADDNLYDGDYSEYDSSIDRTKRGLWPAVYDFLNRHPEWSLYKRLFNNHGFTVLKRLEESDTGN